MVVRTGDMFLVGGREHAEEPTVKTGFLSVRMTMPGKKQALLIARHEALLRRDRNPERASIRFFGMSY